MRATPRGLRSRLKLAPPFDRLWLPVYVPSLLVSASQTALLILLPLHVIGLGFSTVQAALIVGARGIGLFLFDIPAGVLASRYGDRAILFAGLGILVLSSLLIALFENPFVIAFGSFGSGAGFAAWMLGRQSYIADTCAPEETGRAIAVMAGLQRVGILLGPGLGGLIAEAAGYSTTFIVGTAVTIAAFLLVIRLPAAVGDVRHDASLSLAPTIRLARQHAHTFATAGGAAFALQLMRATRTLLIPLFGVALGLDAAAVGLIYSISAAVDMCLFYPVGWVVDRRGRKWSALPSMILFAVSLLVLPLAAGFGSLLAVACLMGLANGLGTGIVMIIGADLSRQADDRSQFLGVWRLIGDLGMSGAPLLSAALVGLSGLAAASLVAAAIGFVGAFIMWTRVPETLADGRGDRAELP